MPPWWIIHKVKPEGPERDMGGWTASSFSDVSLPSVCSPLVVTKPAQCTSSSSTQSLSLAFSNQEVGQALYLSLSGVRACHRHISDHLLNTATGLWTACSTAHTCQTHRESIPVLCTGAASSIRDRRGRQSNRSRCAATGLIHCILLFCSYCISLCRCLLPVASCC